MSKHKSEVLTVKIQLKVKFPEAVITTKVFKTEKRTPSLSYDF